MLSLDARVGDFEKADVLIDGTKIAAIGPNVSAPALQPMRRSSTAQARSSCPASSRRTITSTRRSSEASSRMACLPGAGRRKATDRWSRTSGRPGGSPIRRIPTNFIWDLGRVPHDPEDCYISELVACLSEISEGVTMGTDTSQASHTPGAHRCHDPGTRRLGPPDGLRLQPGDQPECGRIPYEFPGAVGDTTKGIGRIAKTYFSSTRPARDARLRCRPDGSVPGAAAPGGNWVARSGPSSTTTTSVVRTWSSMRPPTRGTSPTGPTSRSSIAPAGKTTRARRSVTTERPTRTPASRRPGRSGATEGAHVSIAVLIEMQMRHRDAASSGCARITASCRA